MRLGSLSLPWSCRALFRSSTRRREFAATNRAIPIIFIAWHGDMPMGAQAMKMGAIEFLTKPFHEMNKQIRPNSMSELNAVPAVTNGVMA
jgi:PleD family two-component response regulator